VAELVRPVTSSAQRHSAYGTQPNRDIAARGPHRKLPGCFELRSVPVESAAHGEQIDEQRNNTMRERGQWEWDQEGQYGGPSWHALYPPHSSSFIISFKIEYSHLVSEIPSFISHSFALVILYIPPPSQLLGPHGFLSPSSSLPVRTSLSCPRLTSLAPPPTASASSSLPLPRRSPRRQPWIQQRRSRARRHGAGRPCRPQLGAGLLPLNVGSGHADGGTSRQ
jgi:hypothetical protein